MQNNSNYFKHWFIPVGYAAGLLISMLLLSVTAHFGSFMWTVSWVLGFLISNTVLAYLLYSDNKIAIAIVTVIATLVPLFCYKLAEPVVEAGLLAPVAHFIASFVILEIALFASE